MTFKTIFTQKHFSNLLVDYLERLCWFSSTAPVDPLVSCFQVNSAWENLNKTWKERVERLDEAMQAAVQFQDGLQVIWLLPLCI